jgi:hypothetical protein
MTSSALRRLMPRNISHSARHTSRVWSGIEIIITKDAFLGSGSFYPYHYGKMNEVESWLR